MCDDQAKEALENAGLRVTLPRLEILKALIKDHGPFSAEELHRKVTSKGVDVATVYRSIEIFERAAIIIKVDFRDGISRYEFRSEKYHHHHVICLCCRKTETVEKCTAGKMDKMVLARGFAKVFHTLEVFGLCPTCCEPKHAH